MNPLRRTSRSQRTLLAALAAALLVPAAVLLSQRDRPGSQDGPGLYLCEAPACAHAFTLDIAAALRQGGEPACPRCGAPGAKQARVCPACRKAFRTDQRGATADTGQPACPHCQAPLPRLVPLTGS